MMHKVINEDGSVSQHCIRTLHAEQNVICQAARFGISLEGATMYMKLTPCFTCAKMLISAGIKRVVAEKKYHRDTYSIKTLKEAGWDEVSAPDSISSDGDILTISTGENLSLIHI